MPAPVRKKRFRLAHKDHDATSRLFAMAFGRYFQRVCRLQRELSQGDIDLAIIAGAAGIVVTDALMRDATQRRDFADIRTIVGERQRGCNALSLAEATGLPRETVRRKMKQLVEMGILVRRGTRDYVWQPGVLQSPPYQRLFEELSAETLRLLNTCLEDGIYDVDPPA
ncbi:hypothetical protein [Vineibacter terrae]|uniref:hypothetical protein n=1 Tax=Vineibacter terrae TaxID=2586908 RepID=UPI002E2FD411|nr:hypothetical protein [Vineibacter terrae]HEX2887729.1 hypothetical protein [Vineibacter terrae]